MKNIYAAALMLLPMSSFANCDEFLNQRLASMNLGTLTSPGCGVMKSEEENKKRISLSKVKGRKDLGPTLSMYTSDPDNIKVVQLLSKDKLTSHRQKYTYVLGTNCSEFKSVTYNLGTLQTEVTKEKCSNIDANFVGDELVHLAANKLCSEFFPEKETMSKADDTNSSKATPE